MDENRAPRDLRAHRGTGLTLSIDCGRCLARPRACDDCVVTVLLGAPGDLVLDSEEGAAIEALSAAGLVPPLRLVTGVDSRDGDGPA